MNKLFVWLVSRFDFLWKSLGADPRALSLILLAKLKMDDRVGYIMGRQQARKTDMQYLIFGLAFLFGGAFVFPLVFMEHQATAMGFIFSFWILYISFLLITEMSESLFDTRDLYILLSRPLNGTTLSLARMLHIGVFTGKFALCLGFIPGCYILLWLGPWAFIIYFVLSLLTIIVTMTSTLVLYLIILRRVAPEKVRNVIGYFQIVATVFFFALYQVPNLLNLTGGEIDLDLAHLSIVGEQWGFVFSGFWIAALWSLLVEGGATVLTYAQAGLGVLAGVVGLIFYVRQSSDYGEKMLSMRHAGSQDIAELDRPDNDPVNHPLRNRWASFFTRPDLERASFKFHWNVMLRDVNFKQRVYPGMAILPVVLVVVMYQLSFITGNGNDLVVETGSLQLLIILYMFSIITIVPLSQTRISDKFKASWIFDATPSHNNGALRYGQILSVWCMFYLPMAIILYPILLFYWGFAYLPDIILSIGATLIITMIYHSSERSLPFSNDKEAGGFNNIGPMMMVFFLAPVFAAGHYFLGKIPYVVYIGIIVAWGIVWVMIKELRAGKD